jgi:hypothetical protein
LSLLISPDSPHGKELWKFEHMQHERHPSDSTIVGMRPSTPQPYPELLYHATSKNPWVFETRLAVDEVAARLLIGQGYSAGGPAMAAEAYDARQQDLAVAAAHRNHEDRAMSPAARAESEAAEEASSRHLGEIPAKPIRPRGPGGAFAKKPPTSDPA